MSYGSCLEIDLENIRDKVVKAKPASGAQSEIDKIDKIPPVGVVPLKFKICKHENSDGEKLSKDSAPPMRRGYSGMII